MSKDQQEQIIGVDVGGTFTDLIWAGEDGVRLAKVPSTLDNQAKGVISAIETVEVDLADVGLVVHGTTTTTNAVLERKLSRTGLITTQGFRDVLELGRRTRPQAYGMKGSFTPIIPRNLRLEVPERMDASGNVLTLLDEAAVREAVAQLLADGCEALVIHYLHAYANPAHELRTAEIVAEMWPNEYVTMGHALLSESREYERGVTASVNASVQPLLERYIARLRSELAEKGYQNDLLVMNGNGGMVSAAQVAREAAKTVMSGPASGVMAAAYTGRRAGFPNLITYDMGGTSTDVALIKDARPSVSNEIEVEYAMPIHVPMVDVRTVGAGGGSIAWVNSAGLLQVGPESAGSHPGPICYGRGGERPTISDANLLLGRLDPGLLNSVEGGVFIDDVAAIFERELGAPLGLSAIEAAAAVIRLANTTMAGATRMVSVSLGEDPRDFALFAFGGAGPLHASAIARELGVPRVLIPARPGITNALGCIVADLRQDYVQTINQPIDSLDIEALHAVLAHHAAAGHEAISAEKVGVESITPVHSLDMQFIGQTHLLRVPLESATPSREELQTLFETAYFSRFQVELSSIRAAVVNANTSVVGARVNVDLATLLDSDARQPDLKSAQVGERQVSFEGTWHPTPIYAREKLPQAAAFTGPAIVTQMDATLLIEPGDSVTSDADGNLIITLGANQ